MKKKKILSLIGLFLLIVGVSAGITLVQQNQEFREKAASNCCGAGSSPICTNLIAGCGHTNVQGFICSDGNPIETWAEENHCIDNRAYVKCSLGSSGDCAAKCVCGSNPPNCDQCSGPGPSGSGSPTSKPTKKPTPKPCSAYGKNPAVITGLGKDGKFIIYIKAPWQLNASFKKNADSCNLDDKDVTLNIPKSPGVTVEKVDTGLNVTSSDKVCVYFNHIEGAEYPAYGWVSPTGTTCGKEKYDIADLISQATDAVATQCWSDWDETPECDFDDFAVAFTIEEGGGPPPSDGTGIKLRFQGITKKAKDQLINASFLSGGSGVWNGQGVNVTNDDSGVYTLNIPGSVSSGTYDLLVKGPSHLQKRFTNIVYNGNDQGVDLSLDEGYQCRAGDVTNDNTISVEDVAQVSQYYTDFAVTVDDGNSGMVASDINKDGLITIQDLALIAINWSDFKVEGDK